MNSRQQRSRELAKMLDVYYEEANAHYDSVTANLLCDFEEALNIGDDEELRRSDNLGLTVRSVYLEARLNDTGRGSVIVSVIVSRNGDESTGGIRFQITRVGDGWRIDTYWDHVPSYYQAAGRFVSLPDGACRLVMDEIKSRVLSKIEATPSLVVDCALMERARYETIRALGQCRRSLEDIARGIER